MRAALGVLDGQLVELLHLREGERDEEVGRRVGRLVRHRRRLRPVVALGLRRRRRLLRRRLELGRDVGEVLAVGDPVRLARRHRVPPVEAVRPVRRRRHDDDEPARLLAARDRVVERRRLADAGVARDDEPRRRAELPLGVQPEQLVAQLERVRPHERRARAQLPLRAPGVAAKVGVVEDAAEDVGRAVELEELAAVGLRVRQRVVARAEEVRRLGAQELLRRLARLEADRALGDEHVAVGRGAGRAVERDLAHRLGGEEAAAARREGGAAQRVAHGDLKTRLAFIA